MVERLLLLSDIDGTVTQNPPILERMAQIQAQRGILREGCLDALNRISTRYHNSENGMSYEQYVNGLLSSYAQGLRGSELADLLSQTREFIDDGTIPFYHNVSMLIRSLQQYDHDVYFITASPQFIGQAIAERFSGSQFISSVFETDNNILTGRVTLSLARGEDKLGAIQKLVQRYPHAGSVALGDSVGDMNMLDSAQVRICVSPKESFRKIALAKGYRIIEGIINKPGEGTRLTDHHLF